VIGTYHLVHLLMGRRNQEVRMCSYEGGGGSESNISRFGGETF
jgi:hypothetical protein